MTIFVFIALLLVSRLNPTLAISFDEASNKAIVNESQELTILWQESSSSSIMKMLRGSPVVPLTDNDPSSEEGGKETIAETTKTLTMSVDAANQILKDAVCYAERYPDLLQGFCQGDSSLCKHEELRRHYDEHGRISNLLWGCRSRVTEHAVPRAIVPPKPSPHLIGGDGKLELHFLIFETSEGEEDETTLIEQTIAAGFRTTHIGGGAKFEGFSTKWQIILKFLKDLNASPDTLLVITDARDVLLNVHNDYINQEDITLSIAEHFTHAYNTLTAAAPGAIVMSAEAQCCVAALTFAQPGSYFDEHGKRSQRACASGAHDCRWGGDSKVVVWEDFQIDLAYNRTGRNVHDVFLNAGLAAGRPADWIRLLETVELEAYEDDQAVFTEYMYHRPDQIVLDYASEMFGNARWPLGMSDKGCPFGQVEAYTDKYGEAFPTLRHLESRTMPLLLHTPGKFFECYDQIAEELGLGLAEDDIIVEDDDSSNVDSHERFLKNKKQKNQEGQHQGQQSNTQNQQAQQQNNKQAKQQNNTQAKQQNNKQAKQQNNNKKTKKPKNVKNKKTKKPNNYVVKVRVF